MIPYGKQTIDEDDIKAVVETLKSDFLTTGPKVKEFEEKFAACVGANYAVAVSSGTAALHVACLAAELKSGDELITSPITFSASANCALYCRAKPMFADIKKENGLIDENLIEAKINSRTRIIVPVHYAGLPCEMEKIKGIADKHNLIVVEDACHALGARYRNSKIGDCKYSDMAVFSFHPVKHITTGEGGIITTNSPELYQKLLLFRTHGITKEPDKLLNKEEGPWFYEIQELGYNYRITDIQCALGISQLRKLDKFVGRRREIARKYDEAFSKMSDIEIINETESKKSSYHLYVIKVKDKDTRLNVFNYLKKNDVLCQVHYIPVHWHPYYQKLGYEKEDCPEAGGFYDRIISLPIFPGLKNEEQDKIINLIKKYYERTT